MKSVTVCRAKLVITTKKDFHRAGKKSTFVGKLKKNQVVSNGRLIEEFKNHGFENYASPSTQ